MTLLCCLSCNVIRSKSTRKSQLELSTAKRQDAGDLVAASTNINSVRYFEREVQQYVEIKSIPKWLKTNAVCTGRCRSLINPSNGFVRVFGITASYSCNAGYRLQGNSVRTCIGFFYRSWSGSTPSCIPIASESKLNYEISES